METPSEDKHMASKYLLDPLIAPQPSDETGPGSHFSSSIKSVKPPSSHSRTPSIKIYPTPPTSASPTKSAFTTSHRQTAFDSYQGAETTGKSPELQQHGRRRGSSLTERYAGDMSHRPLDQIKKETKAANRAPHLKKQYMPGADVIDSLDQSLFGPSYHHEGPYDATLLARNRSKKISPVAATSGMNREALRATPKENIRDALNKHVPLQGTAVIPPGMVGFNGEVMNYKEGADLMREPDAEGGAYKRWAGFKYLPEDYKGKGEPSFSIDRAIKDHDGKSHRHSVSENTNSYEMHSRSRRATGSRQRSVSNGGSSSLQVPRERAGNEMRYSQYENDLRRSHSTGTRERVGDVLKRRLGGLRNAVKNSDS